MGIGFASLARSALSSTNTQEAHRHRGWKGGYHKLDINSPSSTRPRHNMFTVQTSLMLKHENHDTTNQPTLNEGKTRLPHTRIPLPPSSTPLFPHALTPPLTYSIHMMQPDTKLCEIGFHHGAFVLHFWTFARSLFVLEYFSCCKNLPKRHALPPHIQNVDLNPQPRIQPTHPPFHPPPSRPSSPVPPKPATNKTYGVTPTGDM